MLNITDDNGINYDSFTFDVRDDGGTDYGGEDTSTATGTIFFDVTEVSDAPAGTNAILNALESTDFILQISDFGFSDITDGHSFDGIFVEYVNGTGTFTYNNAPAPLWQLFPLA